MNHDENRCTKSASTAREVVAVVQRVDQLLAHAHQRGGAAGREIEPAEQLLPARLGGAHAPRRRSRPTARRARRRWPRRAAPGRGRSACASASKNAMRGPVVSVAYRARISRASATPDASPRPDKQFLAQLDEAFRARRRVAAPVARAVSSARPRSAIVCSISPKNEVFISFSERLFPSGDRAAKSRSQEICIISRRPTSSADRRKCPHMTSFRGCRARCC